MHGWLGFDALCERDPLAFAFDLSAGVDLRARHRRARLRAPRRPPVGPVPVARLRRGLAQPAVLRRHRPLRQDLGRRPPHALPAPDPLPRVLAALADRSSWSGVLPRRRARGRARSPARRPTPARRVLLDPAGSLRIAQRVVPLGQPITRFGGAPLGRTVSSRSTRSRSFGSRDPAPRRRPPRSSRPRSSSTSPTPRSCRCRRSAASTRASRSARDAIDLGSGSAHARGGRRRSPTTRRSSTRRPAAPPGSRYVPGVGALLAHERRARPAHTRARPLRAADRHPPARSTLAADRWVDRRHRRPRARTDIASDGSKLGAQLALQRYLAANPTRRAAPGRARRGGRMTDDATYAFLSVLRRGLAALITPAHGAGGRVGVPVVALRRRHRAHRRCPRSRCAVPATSSASTRRGAPHVARGRRRQRGAELLRARRIRATPICRGATRPTRPSGDRLRAVAVPDRARGRRDRRRRCRRAGRGRSPRRHRDRRRRAARPVAGVGVGARAGRSARPTAPATDFDAATVGALLDAAPSRAARAAALPAPAPAADELSRRSSCRPSSAAGSPGWASRDRRRPAGARVAARAGAGHSACLLQLELPDRRGRRLRVARGASCSRSATCPAAVWQRAARDQPARRRPAALAGRRPGGRAHAARTRRLAAWDATSTRTGSPPRSPHAPTRRRRGSSRRCTAAGSPPPTALSTVRRPRRRPGSTSSTPTRARASPPGSARWSSRPSSSSCSPARGRRSRASARANERLRLAQLARELALRLYTRHFAALDGDACCR